MKVAKAREMYVWQEKLQNLTSEHKDLCKKIKKKKEKLQNVERELQKSEEVCW